jgi:hypothetical protein
MSSYSAYEFHHHLSPAKTHDLNVHYAVGKWYMSRAKLADVVAAEGWRSEAAEEQRATVEYWRSFCEKEFSLTLK